MQEEIGQIDEQLSIERCVQNYPLLASVDYRITEALLDSSEIRSHEAISSENLVNFPDQLPLYVFLEKNYTRSFDFVTYKPCFNEFKNDTQRGHCGFSVVAKTALKKGQIIDGLTGVVGEINHALPFEHDFSTFVCQFTKQSRIMLGPISFVNHSCIPNASYKINISKPGVVRLAALHSIGEGEEITVSYGAKYFDVNGVSTCQCPHETMHVRRKIRSTKNSNKHDNDMKAQVEVLEDEVALEEPEVAENVTSYAPQDAHCVDSQMQCTQSRRSQRKLETFESFWTDCSNDQKSFSLNCTICEIQVDVANMMYHMKLNHRYEAQIPCPFCAHLFVFGRSFVRHFDSHVTEVIKKLTHEENQVTNGNPMKKQEETAISSQQSPPIYSQSSQLHETDTDEENDLVLHNPDSGFVQLLPLPLGDDEIVLPVRNKRKIELNENRTLLCAQEKCFVVCGTVRFYLSHLYLDYCYEKKFNCVFCPRFYPHVNSLRKHLTKCDSKTEGKLKEPLSENSPCDFEEVFPAEGADVKLQLLEKITSGSVGDDVLIKVLSSSSITITKAFDFVEHFGGLFSQTTKLIFELISSDSKIVPEDPTIYSRLASLLNNSCLKTIKNVRDIQKFLATKEVHVPAQEIYLGSRQETMFKDGRPKQVRMKHNFYFVPISEVIKKVMLRDDAIVEQILAYNNFLRKMTDGNLLVDLQQCKTFEENGTPSNSEHLAEIEITSFSFKLCLQLYSDDFEPSNPIGSRKSIHKVTCFYWILKNLPPWLNSQINQVNVVALCNTLDLCRYGYKPVLDKISEDLKKLERPFNVLTKGGSTISVLGAHFSFVADNAEYHSALDFVKNFAKGFCCERCFVSAENFSNYLIESSCPIRKVSSFERHLQRAQSTQRPSKGVKGKCYLETSYFSSYRNWTKDIQHDLFEGGVQYTVKLVLHQLVVVQKIFSCEKLNYRLNSFAYAREKDGKPTEIDIIK